MPNNQREVFMKFKAEVDARAILPKKFPEDNGKDVSYKEVCLISDGEMYKINTKKEGVKEGKQVLEFSLNPRTGKLSLGIL